MGLKKERIWLASERHRRSRELSQSFNAHLVEVLESDNQIPSKFIRYCFLFLMGASVILIRRPRVLFVQNPSIVLTLICSLLKPIMGYALVVDRHSNFKLNLRDHRLKWKIFRMVSNYTLKAADLTIVTNAFLANIVEKAGGKSFVLPDKLPSLRLGKQVPLEGTFNIVAICSFSDDELIDELIEAASLLDKGCMLYFTGDYKKFIIEKQKKELEKGNVRFIGYVTEDVYQSILKSADLVVVLTSEEYLLTCGAYEAISLEKPVVLSNTKTMREYFGDDLIYVDPKPTSIAEGIMSGISNLDEYRRRSQLLRRRLLERWEGLHQELNKILQDFS